MRALLVVVLGVFALGTSSATAQKRPTAPALDLSNMVEVEAGSFVMGQPLIAPGPYGDAWFVDQTPERSVDLSSFYLDKHEVTVEEFALFLSYAGGLAHFHDSQPIEQVADGFLSVRGKERQPIRHVTWQAAAHYCAWAGKRLPTEAEWERAAAGVDKRPFPWGSDGPTCARASFNTGSSRCASAPTDVLSRPEGATPDGIHDLAGNVAEWVEDNYGPYPSSAERNPRGAADGVHKVVRGGGFLDGGLSIRSHARASAPPAARSANIGFRCASTGVAPSGTRGMLTPPSDEERVQKEEPSAPLASLPEVLAAGLFSPGAVVRSQDDLVVVENGAGRVLRVEPDSGETEPLLDGLLCPCELAAAPDALYVSDSGLGDIWRLSGGAADAVVEGEDAPGRMLLDGEGVVFATASAIRRVASSGGLVEELAADLDGIGGMAFVDGELYFAELGNVSAGRHRVARIDPAGVVETVLGTETLGDFLRPTDVVEAPGGGRALFPLVMRPWPNVALLCGIPSGGGDLGCHSYGPPFAFRLATAGSVVYWSSERDVVRYDLEGDGPFELPGAWTRAGGLVAEEGVVVWSDEPTGRLLRVEQP